MPANRYVTHMTLLIHDHKQDIHITGTYNYVLHIREVQEEFSDFYKDNISFNYISHGLKLLAY